MTDTPPTASGATPEVTSQASPALEATTVSTQEVDDNLSLDEVKKLRKSDKLLRDRLKTFEDAEAAKNAAALSEVDKANKRASEFETKYQQSQKQLVNTQARMVAQTKNIINPDIAVAAIADKLLYGDDGVPTNLEALLDELIKNNPYLVKSADISKVTPTITANNPGRSQTIQPGQPAIGQRTRLSDLLK